ncbi:hypothetical protein RHMOL_Rhmol01G0171200 [Rhododendron molle]|uniref:Uncharacterized protein n=1 Tax=Rhododendron molle TaxID=49168 RepID=A0ACC0Q523_RHOML|nr:hypothetical protein RHMOL_Rhmol01G0171200 [Rhododendron molle]
METTENSVHTVEEPKEGMIFDTQEEAYLYYSTYAKEKGFVVARRNSRKGNRGGKAQVKTTNPVKPRPQTKLTVEVGLICLRTWMESGR